MSTAILSPIDGRAMPLAEVPDPVFATEMVGSGAAVEPIETDEPTTVRSPIAGAVVKLHPHAAIVVSDGGVGVLIHVGINTVGRTELFSPAAAEGDVVEAGDPLIVFSPNAVRRAGFSAVVPVVVMDTEPGSATETALGPVTAGAPLFSI